MAFETLEEMNKKTTAPITLRTFEPMLENKPLQFEYNGQAFVIPLGEDVQGILIALIQLVNDTVADNNAFVDTDAKRIAVKFANEFIKHNSQLKTKPRIRDKEPIAPKKTNKPKFYTISQKELNKLGRK